MDRKLTKTTTSARSHPSVSRPINPGLGFLVHSVIVMLDFCEPWSKVSTGERRRVYFPKTAPKPPEIGIGTGTGTGTPQTLARFFFFGFPL